MTANDSLLPPGSWVAACFRDLSVEIEPRQGHRHPVGVASPAGESRSTLTPSSCARRGRRAVDFSLALIRELLAGLQARQAEIVRPIPWTH